MVDHAFCNRAGEPNLVVKNFNDSKGILMTVKDDAENSLEGEVTKTVETAFNGKHKDTKTSSEGSQVTKPVNGENEKDVETEIPIAKRKTGLHLFFMNISRVYKYDELESEIATIAVPAALALAADPLTSLIDAAFIGRIEI